MQSVWIGIWSWFGGSWSGIKRKKWQKGVEKLCFSISHEHAENLHSHEKWNRKDFGCSSKRKSENWFRVNVKISHNHAKCSKKAKIVLMNFPLRTIMRNCWNSCKIAFFYRFLGEEAFERPFRWCQVSTWPWPINRNLIYSFWKDIYISNRRTFQISSLYRIFYFPSFSLIFSLTKHVLWDQISKYEWLNLVFLEGGKI